MDYSILFPAFVILLMVAILPFITGGRAKENAIVSKLIEQHEWVKVKRIYVRHLYIWGPLFILSALLLTYSIINHSNRFIHFGIAMVIFGYKTFDIFKALQLINCLILNAEALDRQTQKEEEEVKHNHNFFWNKIAQMDWTAKGDDDKVLAPLVDSLAMEDDENIFLFDDLLTHYLQQLDTRRNFERCKAVSGHDSGEHFLHSRCVAVANGKEFYWNCLISSVDDVWNLEFEKILHAPKYAWMQKHNSDCEWDYPHTPSKSYITGCNPEFEASAW